MSKRVGEVGVVGLGFSAYKEVMGSGVGRLGRPGLRRGQLGHLAQLARGSLSFYFYFCFCLFFLLNFPFVVLFILEYLNIL